VVDPFLREEPDFIERLRNILLLAPVDVPIILLSLAILPPCQRFLDAICEVGLEFEIRTVLGGKYYERG
jgi:hypothetical protein